MALQLNRSIGGGSSRNRRHGSRRRRCCCCCCCCGGGGRGQRQCGVPMILPDRLHDDDLSVPAPVCRPNSPRLPLPRPKRHPAAQKNLKPCVFFNKSDFRLPGMAGLAIPLAAGSSGLASGAFVCWASWGAAAGVKLGLRVLEARLRMPRLRSVARRGSIRSSSARG